MARWEGYDAWEGLTGTDGAWELDVLEGFASMESVRNLLMVPSGTRTLKATVQEVSVNKDWEEEGGVECSDEEEGCNVEDVEEVNDGQHKVWR
jgi:hypothetical protein